MRTAIIVPSGTGGVVDYAREICARMPESICLPFDEQLRVVDSDRVLIQYSGYGFQRRGVAVNLVKWANNLSPSQTVGIYFHELSASGWPWQSAYWLSPLQRLVARELQKRSAFWLTNTLVHHRRLLQSDCKKPNAQLPVCSSVGELQDEEPHKQPVLAIFGSAPLRTRLLRQHGALVAAFCTKNNLAVWDIGPAVAPEYFSIFYNSGVPLTVFGKLSAEDVHARLTAASFGAIDYPTTHLDKSSVFAAYCAHAICPVVISGKSSLAYDTHEEGGSAPVYHNLVAPIAIANSTARELGEVARRRHAHYSIQRHADAYLEMFIRS